MRYRCVFCFLANLLNLLKKLPAKVSLLLAWVSSPACPLDSLEPGAAETASVSPPPPPAPPPPFWYLMFGTDWSRASALLACRLRTTRLKRRGGFTDCGTVSLASPPVVSLRARLVGRSACSSLLERLPMAGGAVRLDVSPRWDVRRKSAARVPASGTLGTSVVAVVVCAKLVVALFVSLAANKRLSGDCGVSMSTLCTGDNVRGLSLPPPPPPEMLDFCWWWWWERSDC